MQKGRRILLITGTSSGLGKDLSKYFLRKNYIVLGCSRGKSKISSKFYKHRVLNLNDETEVKKWVNDVYVKYKKIDYLIIPVGDGNIISGCLKGFNELYENNFIKYKPNFVGVQSSQSSSFYKQFKNNSSIPKKDISVSKCDSINVDYPLDGHFAYKYLKKMKGFMMKENDSKIIKSRSILLRQYGINCCLASASTFASLNSIISQKKLKNKNILLLLTGTGYKDIGEV